jgi:hypothetical protein
MFNYQIKADGTVKTLPNDELATLQEAVGGLIQFVPCPFGTCYANEEGLLLGLPINRVATAMCGQPIVGDIAISCDKAFFDKMAAEAAEKNR